MRLREFDETANSALKLAALSQFLSDRAEDEAASKQISQKAFIDLAQSMGVNVTEQNLGDIEAPFAELGVEVGRLTSALELLIAPE